MVVAILNKALQYSHIGAYSVSENGRESRRKSARIHRRLAIDHPPSGRRGQRNAHEEDAREQTPQDNRKVNHFNAL